MPPGLAPKPRLVASPSSSSSPRLIVRPLPLQVATLGIGELQGAVQGELAGAACGQGQCSDRVAMDWENDATHLSQLASDFVNPVAPRVDGPTSFRGAFGGGGGDGGDAEPRRLSEGTPDAPIGGQRPPRPPPETPQARHGKEGKGRGGAGRGGAARCRRAPPHACVRACTLAGHWLRAPSALPVGRKQRSFGPAAERHGAPGAPLHAVPPGAHQSALHPQNPCTHQTHGMDCTRR